MQQVGQGKEHLVQEEEEEEEGNFVEDTDMDKGN